VSTSALQKHWEMCCFFPFSFIWLVNCRVEDEPVDFELPSQHQQTELKVPSLVEERSKFKFQEKKISRPVADDDATPSTFTGFKKKGNFRGNTRQRLDTDD